MFMDPYFKNKLFHLSFVEVTPHMLGNTFAALQAHRATAGISFTIVYCFYQTLSRAHTSRVFQESAETKHCIYLQF